MIKNMVFDLGGVLIDFNEKNYLQKIGLNKDDVLLFSNIIFHSSDWGDYNTSKYNLLETKNNLIKKYPTYTQKINYIFDNLDFQYILFEIKDTAKYLIELKKKNYNIFVLSDASKDCYEYFKIFEFFKFVDGAVYSFEVGFNKPNEKNYTTLLNKYNLIPEETIFIDDKLENIDMANKFNIHAILFTNLEDLKNKILKLL